MSGEPMDPKKLAELRRRLESPSDVIWSAATDDGLDIFELVDDLLADRDHQEGEKDKLIANQLVMLENMERMGAESLDTARLLAEGLTWCDRWEAEAKRLQAEVVHLESELRIRVAKLAAS